jgi:hypothetical protein
MVTTSSRMLQRRRTAAQWTSENPVLGAGEIGVESDTLAVKIGNGATAWNSLSYPKATHLANTPAGSIEATTVQAAINELGGDVDGLKDQVVNAKDHGAVGNGTTDDTAALTAAFNAAVAAGRICVIPPGTYQALDVPLPAGLSVRGYGARTTLRRPSTGTGGLSNVLRPNGSNITIADLTLDGNRAGLAQGDNRGVIDGSVAGANNIVIERCTITEGAEKGIRFVNHGSGLVVRHCTITNMDEDAILVQQTTQDGDGVTIEGNAISGVTLGGILVRGSNDGTTWFQRRVVCANNRVQASGLCIELWCEDVAITGNVTDGGTFGISKGPGMRGAIAGNVCRNATVIGIEVAATDNSEWVACTGNTVVGAGVALSASASANFVTMCGNTVDYTGTSHAVHLTNVDTAVVNDNVIRTNGSQYGIRFQSGVTAQANGNFVDGQTSAAASNGIFFGDITHLTCVGNLIRNWNFGIRLSSASSLFEGTISANHVDNNTDPFDDELTGTATMTGVVFSGNRPTIP